VINIFEYNEVNVMKTWAQQELKPFYGVLDLGADWRGFNASTSVKTYFYKDTGISFIAPQVDYRIGIAYTYKSVTIGYKHMCSHGIQNKLYDEGYDRIYFKYTFWR
jgi:hypothetical protein